MVAETYPCYVRIGEGGGSDELVELPTEADGTLLLSTITAQYPDAIGLRFKSETGSWRGVRVTDGALDVPLDGWGDRDYVITVPKTAPKRKLDADDGPLAKKTQEEMLADLIVLGLPYSTTEDDLKNYFEKFGELAHWEIKTDRQTNKSKGYGFVRFTQVEVVEAVLAASHTIDGRKCEVRFPRKNNQQMSFGMQDGIATKLFIGRLPRGATTEDLRTCFAEYGPLKDVYVPSNFRGFGFVTFASQAAAQAAMNTQHVIKGNYVNITFPSPKPGESNPQNMQMQQPQQQYGYGNMQGNFNQGNGQQQQQQGGWYGNQQPMNKNSGYSSYGYYQSGNKMPSGKVS